MTRPSRKITATLLAVAGLSSLSPMQQGAALLTAAGAALWASPAMASTNLPGVGLVIKKKPGNATIIAPADANGETRLTGLEPGTYTVRVFEGEQEVPMRVGRDGRLAFVAYEETIPNRGIDKADIRRSRALPLVRRWAEQIAFGEEGGSGTIIAIVAARALAIDVNTANDKQLIEGTRNTPEAARGIIAERARGGPFKDAVDFAQRVCPNTTVDFDDASLRMGDMVILMKRGGNPKEAGWKCARGTGELELFGRKHNYVGHVTLLR